MNTQLLLPGMLFLFLLFALGVRVFVSRGMEEAAREDPARQDGQIDDI